MIKPEQIPDEVVEAAIDAMSDCGSEVIGSRMARASIAAALSAWPGMMPVSEVFTAGGDFYRPHLILPLPQEGA